MTLHQPLRSRGPAAASDRSNTLKRSSKSKRSAPIHSGRSTPEVPVDDDPHPGIAHSFFATRRKGANGKASEVMTLRLAKPWKMFNDRCSKPPDRKQRQAKRIVEIVRRLDERAEANRLSRSFDSAKCQAVDDRGLKLSFLDTISESDSHARSPIANGAQCAYAPNL